MTAAKKLAREYELIYILRPDAGASGGRKVSDRITDVLDKQGARMTRVDQWGRRKLAYPIGSYTRGIFVYVRFVAFPDAVSELERNLRNLDQVVRYQTVRLEGLYDLAELQVDDEEVQFADVEDAGEEDDEPTFEERLGMRRREPEPREGDAEAKAEGDAEAKAEGDAEAKAEGDAEAKAEGDAEAKAEGDAEAKAEGDAEAKAEGDAEAKAEGDAEAKAEGDAEPAADDDEKKEG